MGGRKLLLKQISEGCKSNINEYDMGLTILRINWNTWDQKANHRPQLYSPSFHITTCPKSLCGMHTWNFNLKFWWLSDIFYFSFILKLSPLQYPELSSMSFLMNIHNLGRFWHEQECETDKMNSKYISCRQIYWFLKITHTFS